MKRIILAYIAQFIVCSAMCQDAVNDNRHQFTVCWEDDAMPVELSSTTVGVSENLIREIITRAMNERLRQISSSPCSHICEAEFKYHSTGHPTDLITATVTSRDDDAEKALREFLAEVEKMRHHGFTSGEILLAKSGILTECRADSDTTSIKERTLSLLDDNSINQAAETAVSADNMHITHIAPVRPDPIRKHRKSRKKLSRAVGGA